VAEVELEEQVAGQEPVEVELEEQVAGQEPVEVSRRQVASPFRPENG
jgi:hypothetical protein